MRLALWRLSLDHGESGSDFTRSHLYFQLATVHSVVRHPRFVYFRNVANVNPTTYPTDLDLEAPGFRATSTKLTGDRIFGLPQHLLDAGKLSR
jgi:hypothetical protein